MRISEKHNFRCVSSTVEWHRVVQFWPRLAERVVATIKKGAHVPVDLLAR